MTKKKLDTGFERLRVYYETYQLYSMKFSEALRRVAFFEGAILWVFSVNNPYNNLTHIIALWLIALFFVADCCQYYCGMRDYERFAEKIRIAIEKNKNQPQARYTDKNKKSVFFFNVKALFLVVSTLILFYDFGSYLMQILNNDIIPL